MYMYVYIYIYISEKASSFILKMFVSRRPRTHFSKPPGSSTSLHRDLVTLLIQLMIAPKKNWHLTTKTCLLGPPHSVLPRQGSDRKHHRRFRSETQENQNNVLWKQTGGFGRNLGTVSFQHPVPK